MVLMKRKGSGKTKGATSFVAVTLGELNRVLRESAVVVVSRKYAEQLRLESKPMYSNYKNLEAHTKQIEVNIDAELEDTINFKVE
jgi:hypothetical protein